MFKQILIIWDGVSQHFSQQRMACVKHIKEIYPEINIACITKLADIIPIPVDEIIPWNDFEIMVWEKWYVKSDAPDLMSNYFRYLYLSINPYTLYLDTDMMLHSKIETTDYLARYKKDSCAIWNGKETGFFEYLVSMRSDNRATNHLMKFFPDDCGDLSKYMTHKQL